jgi:hypothetical protein
MGEHGGDSSQSKYSFDANGPCGSHDPNESVAVSPDNEFSLKLES